MVRDGEGTRSNRGKKKIERAKRIGERRTDKKEKLEMHHDQVLSSFERIAFPFHH